MGHHIATSGYGFQYTQMVETRLRFVKKRKIKVTMVNGWSSGLTQLYIPKIAQGSCLLTGGEPGSLKHMAFRYQNWPWTAWLVKSLFVLCDMWKNIPWYTWSWLDTSSISFTLVIKHGNGRSPTTAGFNGKITHTWGTLHCHIWLPAGILVDVFGSWIIKPLIYSSSIRSLLSTVWFLPSRHHLRFLPGLLRCLVTQTQHISISKRLLTT